MSDFPTAKHRPVGTGVQPAVPPVRRPRPVPSTAPVVAATGSGLAAIAAVAGMWLATRTTAPTPPPAGVAATAPTVTATPGGDAAMTQTFPHSVPLSLPPSTAAVQVTAPPTVPVPPESEPEFEQVSTSTTVAPPLVVIDLPAILGLAPATTDTTAAPEEPGTTDTTAMDGQP